MQIPYVKRQEVENFAKNYKVDGVHIIVDDVAKEFAHQYANLLLWKHTEVNILIGGEALKMAAAEAQKDKPGPKIVL